MNCITNYNELPVGRYLDICDLIRDDAADQVDKQAGILSILSGLPVSEVLALSIGEYTALAAVSKFLEEPVPPVKAVTKAVKLGDLELVPLKDIAKMTAAQYIDFQTLNTGKDTDIVPLLSCLLVPKGHAYCEGYDIADVQAVIRDIMPTPLAVGLLAFFFKKLRSSILTTATSLGIAAKMMRRKDPRRMTIEKMMRAARSSSGAGAGSAASI